jgi:hypothetical protein
LGEELNGNIDIWEFWVDVDHIHHCSLFCRRCGDYYVDTEFTLDDRLVREEYIVDKIVCKCNIN